MKVTAKDFDDNPTLTPLQIINKLENEQWNEYRAVQRKRKLDGKIKDRNENQPIPE